MLVSSNNNHSLNSLKYTCYNIYQPYVIIKFPKYALTEESALNSLDDNGEDVLCRIVPFLLPDFIGEEENGLISEELGSEIGVVDFRFRG